MSSLEANIESLIFCSPKAIKIGDIKRAFYENEKKEFEQQKIEVSNKEHKSKYIIALFKEIKKCFIESYGQEKSDEL